MLDSPLPWYVMIAVIWFGTRYLMDRFRRKRELERSQNLKSRVRCAALLRQEHTKSSMAAPTKEVLQKSEVRAAHHEIEPQEHRARKERLGWRSADQNSRVPRALTSATKGGTVARRRIPQISDLASSHGRATNPAGLRNRRTENNHQAPPQLPVGRTQAPGSGETSTRPRATPGSTIVRPGAAFFQRHQPQWRNDVLHQSLRSVLLERQRQQARRAAGMLQITDNLVLSSPSDAAMAASILDDPNKTIRLPKRLIVNVRHLQDANIEGVLIQLGVRMSSAQFEQACPLQQQLVLTSMVPVFLATHTMAYLLSIMPNLQSLVMTNLFLSGDMRPLVQVLQQSDLTSLVVTGCQQRSSPVGPWRDLLDVLLCHEGLTAPMTLLQKVIWNHSHQRVEHIADFEPGNSPISATARLSLLQSMESFQVGLSDMLSDTFLEDLVGELQGLSNHHVGSLTRLGWGKSSAVTSSEARRMAVVLQAPSSSIQTLEMGLVDDTPKVMLPVWEALRTNTTLKTISFSAVSVTAKEANSKLLCDVLKNENFVLEQCHMGQSLAGGVYFDRAQFYLKLNRLGRRRLLRGDNVMVQEWVSALIANKNDPSIVMYLLQHNPSVLPS